jgi:hypothetical protein
MPWTAKRAASRNAEFSQGAGDGSAHVARSTGAFPIEIPDGPESQGIREALPWGPQILLLFCVFGWLMLGTLWDLIPRDIAIAAGLALALLAAASVILMLRRHDRRVVLVPLAGEIGLYREGQFAYRFSASSLRKEGFDWVYPIKMLVLLGILVLLTGGLLAVELRDLPKRANDLWAFAYVFAYACIAFAAVVRSQLLMVWYWIPEGAEGGTRRVGVPRRQARKLQSAK